MPKQEVPVTHLQQFLPDGTGEFVTAFLVKHKVHLTITRERKTVLGDYRHRTPLANHRISVNGSLNKYAFLITLLHELAHLLAFENHGNRIAPHGKEWKTVFGGLLKQFLSQPIFPSDIKATLERSVQNPAASSCADDALLRVLKKYDKAKENHLLVEDIPAGRLFQTTDGRIFQKGEKLRKRIKCAEKKTGKLYLFSPVYEVLLLPSS